MARLKDDGRDEEEISRALKVLRMGGIEFVTGDPPSPASVRPWFRARASLRVATRRLKYTKLPELDGSVYM